MILFPNAKINLGLNIVEKRKDGFHNLETLFYPINWCDILEINESKEFKFESSGLLISGELNDNLCVKAYYLLKDKFNLPPIHLHLHKVIPMGAGLGGGSADASFTLLGLNELFHLKLSKNELISYAEKLGSDCAFFIHNQACLGKEKGNLLEPVVLNLSDYWIFLIFPNIGISTAQAFAGIKPHIPNQKIEEIIQKPLMNWKNTLKNDFENSLFPLHPELKQIKEALYKEGAVYASMSGSGSTLYGIFENKPKLGSKFNNYQFFETILAK